MLVIGRPSTRSSNDSRFLPSNFHSCLKPDSMPDVWFSSMRTVTSFLSAGVFGQYFAIASSSLTFFFSCSFSSAAAANCLLTDAQSHSA